MAVRTISSLLGHAVAGRIDDAYYTITPCPVSLWPHGMSPTASPAEIKAAITFSDPPIIEEPAIVDEAGNAPGLIKPPLPPFLRLLPELRHEIYNLVLKANYHDVDRYRDLSHFSAPDELDGCVSKRPNILRVCHKVYNEALPVLYRESTFNIEIDGPKPLALPLYGEALNYIQKVELYLDFGSFIERKRSRDEWMKLDTQFKKLGDSDNPKDFCHVTIGVLPLDDMQGRLQLMAPIKKLQGFREVILDLFLLGGHGYDINPHRRLCWENFEFLAEELGPGQFSTYQGHDCIRFWPLEFAVWKQAFPPTIFARDLKNSSNQPMCVYSN